MLARGDQAGYLIATSCALGLEVMGGDVHAALATFERLSPEIHRIPDPLEQHLALNPSLYLYQCTGQWVNYMQQACRMFRLVQQIGHGGMQLAAMVNIGIAHYLAGDELQARDYLERALAGNGLGGWVRFAAVAVLAELYVSAGELDKTLPLLQVWAFPEHPAEVDGNTLLHFRALGAEVHARLGQVAQTQAYLDLLAAVPDAAFDADARCRRAMARALHHRALHQGGQEREAHALTQLIAAGDRSLPSRLWWMAAELVAAQGDHERAYQLLAQCRQREQDRSREVAAVRHVAAQFELDASERAVEAAQRDLLTGLGNRERLIAVGDIWLGRGLAPTVAMLNVRRFKAINEALGRDVGDAVLQAVADRLRQACLCCDHALAGRIYADQFALVVGRGKGDAQLLDGAAAELFATPLEVAGQAGRMREVRALGFEWSIDDFGTGQSSLAYLHMLPVTELKIDRSFVRGAANTDTMLTLLKAAIDLGRNLGLCTVGEGAETADEWALLRELGCDVAQGWYGARPMPEAALVPWLRQRPPVPVLATARE